MSIVSQKKEENKKNPLDSIEGLDFSHLTHRQKMAIIFALGRAYMLCQLLGQNKLGMFDKNEFKEIAEILGAKI